MDQSKFVFRQGAIQLQKRFFAFAYVVLRTARLLLACFFLTAAGCSGAARPDDPSLFSCLCNIPYGADERQRLDIYEPVAGDSVGGRPVVIFFYGGASRSGQKGDYKFVANTLTTRGIVVVIADYRLYPQTYPGFVEDCALAVSWTYHHVQEYGGDKNRIFLMGYSTGAYIAAMLTLDTNFLKLAGANDVTISGMIGLAGIYDFPFRSTSEIKSLFQTISDPGSAALNRFITGRNPPMLLLNGDSDDKSILQSAASLADSVKSRGGAIQTVIYPNLGHLGVILPFTPLFHNQSPVVNDVVSFIKE